jgi:hypothetical protein
MFQPPFFPCLEIVWWMYQLGIIFALKACCFNRATANAKTAPNTLIAIHDRHILMHFDRPHLAALYTDSTSSTFIGIDPGKVISPGN